MQIPNYVNPYIQPQMQQYQAPAPNYNAVKIDVHNPMVNTPGTMAPQYSAPAVTQAPQYATPTMPYYTYPQAQLYNYPQTMQQPYYMPPVQQMPLPEQAAPAAVEVAAPQIAQQNINAPQAPAVPEPVVTQPAAAPQPAQAPVEAAKPEVVPAAPLAPQVDLNSFISKLTNPDYEVQAATMEEMANMVKDDPQKATELLDVKVMDALTNIVNADTSKLAGPSQEQIAARQKLLSNQQMTDAEKQLATTITPMELAERNKSYAMFTSAILQKLYGDEVAKLTNTTVPLTELPGAVTIVEQLKNNPNPMVRTSAIEALSYIQTPSYKQDLNTLFTIAKNDEDKGVQEAAAAALDKLNQMAA